MEIGSEFWLESIPDYSSKELPEWLMQMGNTVLTSSGRGAITLLLEQIKPKNKSVLLPAYICESVILPFVNQGYTCHYYEVDGNLTPNLDSIKSFEDIGVFFHMGYYGFFTNSNLTNVLKKFRNQSTIVIEDITHNLFSSFDRYKYNDFYVGSIRKWFGIPSGGFLSTSVDINVKNLTENTLFKDLRLEALLNKGEYIKNNTYDLKELALKQFSEAEVLLDSDLYPYQMDNLSLSVIKTLDEENLTEKRRSNFNRLSEEISTIKYIQSLFRGLEPGVCPLFFPVLIKGDRSLIRKKLTEENIYCPVHWPLPSQIDIYEMGNTMSIYNNVLSIPCDQRYRTEDMDRVIGVLKSIQ